MAEKLNIKNTLSLQIREVKKGKEGGGEGESRGGFLELFKDYPIYLVIPIILMIPWPSWGLLTQKEGIDSYANKDNNPKNPNKPIYLKNPNNQTNPNNLNTPPKDFERQKKEQLVGKKIARSKQVSGARLEVMRQKTSDMESVKVAYKGH